MGGISDGGQELGVAARAADIFRWASVFAGSAAHGFCARSRHHQFLDGDQVFPVVAQVVDIREPPQTRFEHGLQPGFPLVDHGLGFWPLFIRDSVALPADLILMQVTTMPTHCTDQRPVELGQGDVLGDQDPPPYERLNILQLHPQLRLHGSEFGYAARDSARGSNMATRHGKSSSMRLMGCSAILSRTCRRYRCGSMSWSRQGPTRL